MSRNFLIKMVLNRNKKELLFCLKHCWKRPMILFGALFSSCLFSISFAQDVHVTAKMDSTEIWIGQQTKLNFEVVQSKNKTVKFPLFSDTIVGNLEIVERNKFDTIHISNENLQITSSYTVTSFEDSLLYIPPFPFVVGKDTIWSNSLALRVIQPFEIDTASNSITDIKPVVQPPFDWKRFFTQVFLVLIIVALLIILFILLKKYLRKKPKGEEKIPVVTISPHEEALQKLDKLKEAKLWQQNRVKEYHTELTDIIRIYIDKMFNIRSLEMTSDEILNHTEFLKADKSGAYKNLRQILTLADLVKFAKWNPSPMDNESSLMNAYLFVNQTKIEDIKPLESVKNQLQDNE